MHDRDPSLTVGNISPTRLPPIETLPEWGLLVGEDIQVTPGASAESDLAVEAKRTRLSIDCAVEAYRGDTKKFSRLTSEEREDLHQTTREIIGDDETLDAFSYLLLTHDIGKSDRVRQAVGAKPDVDHDQAYAMLVTDPAHEAARQKLMPSFDLLSQKAQQLIMRAAKLRSNYPQTLQGEAPAATLEDIHSEPNPKVRGIDILKAKFDIFGAAGHVNQEVSLTATSSTYRRMKNLDNALQDPRLATAQERNDAFLDAEIAYFIGPVQPETEQELAELRALARLECHLRIEDKESFNRLRADFDAQAEPVKAILAAELSRSSRATLAYYSPEFVRTIAKKYGGAYALRYFAHVLQEAHIADKEARRAGLSGIATVQLEGIIRAINRDEFDPTQSSMRFVPQDGALIAVPREPSLESLDGLPEFTAGETLRDKRILLIGEGGGSDGIQAAMVGKIMASKYGCQVMAVASVRNEERIVTNTGQQLGMATKQITSDTKAVGDWRFLEKVPLEDDTPTPMFILNSTDPAIIQNDIKALIEGTDAEVVIGVDTGGNSLYRAPHPDFSAHLPTEITPDQDYTVIPSLSQVAAEHRDIKVLSAVVAPGVDSPAYAREVLEEAGAAQLRLSDTDVNLIRQTYADWRMDGSGSEEGR